MSSKKCWLDVENDFPRKYSQTNPISWSSSSESDEHLVKRKKHHWTNSDLIKSTKTGSSDENIEDSPLIGTNPHALSPILTQISRETSPIIGNRRRPFRKKILRESPDIFESHSDNGSVSTSQGMISQDLTCCRTEPPASLTIEAFPSQNSSQVIASDKSSDLSVNQQPEVKKKKRFKAGGLASQLHSALKLQAASSSLFLHEVGLKKEEFSGDVSKILDFEVEEDWVEFGCRVLGCKNGFLTAFVVILGHGAKIDVEVKIGDCYKLYPPYSEAILDYKGKKVKAFYNVSKYLRV